MNADGSFTYTPRPDFTGIDQFTYRAKDVSPISSRNVPATVTITVKSGLYSISLSPLKSPAQAGSAVPIAWTLKDAAGRNVLALSTLLKMESVFNGPAPRQGCVASAGGTREVLYGVPDGATGGSTFRLVSDGYKFNWDTSTALKPPVVTGKGCYTVLLYLADGSAPKMTTAVELK